MRRKLFDYLLSTIGAVMVVVLAAAFSAAISEFDLTSSAVMAGGK